VVEIKGERTLAPSCCRTATAGLEVLVSDRAVKSQKMVLEMLLSDMPDVGYKWNDASSASSLAAATGDTPGSSCGEPKSSPGASPIAAGCSDRDAVGQHGELSDWAARMDVTVRPELQALRREQPACDVSHPAMAVNLDACIQCNRCVRACREEQVNDVIGYANRGAHSQIVFDLDDEMGSSTCVARSRGGAHSRGGLAGRACCCCCWGSCGAPLLLAACGAAASAALLLQLLLGAATRGASSRSAC
jgi:formate dehydrogenase major subunit